MFSFDVEPPSEMTNDVDQARERLLEFENVSFSLFIKGRNKPSYWLALQLANGSLPFCLAFGPS
ncbi:conserved hypothetical protein [Ricinus communis]|uniref:Uncharacterized protein n=1 Tax=Ricinus communis TaxID=3988 RepID=B9SUR3_RICCO|nr:conserved hypothetical protein [Ricinus communis]